MTGFRKLALAGLAAMCVLSLAAEPLLALLVRPVVLELASTGAGAASSLEVINDRNVPMTVEVVVQDLNLPEKGNLVLTPNTGSDFLIFPTIAKIQPGARQVFRVRYVGTPNPEKSRLFMFSTSELPLSIDSAEKRAQMQVLYSINSVVAVRPPKATSAIKVGDIRPATNAKGEKGVDVTFLNEGNAHGFIGAASMSLSGGGWKKALDADAMSKAFGLGLIPAQSRRTLFLAVPDLPATGAFAGEVKPAA